MKEKVYFMKISENEEDESILKRLESLIESRDLLSIIEKFDMVALKSHFGESPKSGYVRPAFLKMIGDLIKKRKGQPFLTETSTLYKGKRSNAVNHAHHLENQGFGMARTQMPFIPADGLFGDEECEIEIPGKIYTRIKTGYILDKIQSLVMVSHFTGHMLAGFGAALKNLGMGLSSRKGKMIQHSTMKPKVKETLCTGCEMCVKWCPTGAVSMEGETALINQEACIGCGQCLAVCRFYAVEFNWGSTYEDIQKKIVEHAWGAHKANEGKNLYINFLNKISKDCDCLPKYEQIVPDVGIVLSYDPVAADAASLDLVEEKAGKELNTLGYDIPYRFQVDYAREVGFGNPDYEIEEV
jgi:uncharacterized Fe-S center protein